MAPDGPFIAIVCTGFSGPSRPPIAYPTPNSMQRGDRDRRDRGVAPTREARSRAPRLGRAAARADGGSSGGGPAARSRSCVARSRSRSGSVGVDELVEAEACARSQLSLQCVGEPREAAARAGLDGAERDLQETRRPRSARGPRSTRGRSRPARARAASRAHDGRARRSMTPRPPRPASALVRDRLGRVGDGGRGRRRSASTIALRAIV